MTTISTFTTASFTTSGTTCLRSSATASTIACPPATTRLFSRPGRSEPSAAARRPSLPERLRSTASLIGRFLPARGSSTPSNEAISSLSPIDRLGERR